MTNSEVKVDEGNSEASYRNCNFPSPMGKLTLRSCPLGGFLKR